MRCIKIAVVLLIISIATGFSSVRYQTVRIELLSGESSILDVVEHAKRYLFDIGYVEEAYNKEISFQTIYMYKLGFPDIQLKAESDDVLYFTYAVAGAPGCSNGEGKLLEEDEVDKWIIHAERELNVILKKLEPPQKGRGPNHQRSLRVRSVPRSGFFGIVPQKGRLS